MSPYVLTLHRHFVSAFQVLFFTSMVGQEESVEVELEGEVNRIALHRVSICMLMSLF